MKRALACALGCFALLAPSRASAQTTAPDTAETGHEKPIDPRRLEVAGFPLVAGNTDIGVQLGGVLTITRFHDTVAPYLWNIDLVLSTSVKDDQSGFRFVQQSHVLHLDLPDLLGGRLRLDTRGSFERTVDEGYYGLGDSSALAPVPGEPGKAYERYTYLHEEGRLRSLARVHTHTPLDIAFLGALRYVAPTVYAGSKLADDIATGQALHGPRIYGRLPTMLLKLGTGVVYDTRDSEFITHHGVWYQAGVSGSAGTSSENLRYGEATVVLAHYVPLGGMYTFAGRITASFQFGRVPFYDLAQGGPFDTVRMFGGESGVRGVPAGRYSGLIKTVTNLELRSAWRRWRVLGERLRLGTTTFLDMGRLWREYGADPAHDGRGVGLKWGVGGGMYLQWGDAAIFRIEAAYSPDAKSASAGLPLGIYASDGLMF